MAAVAWFRRRDGVLVAARYPANLELFARRGYEPVPVEQAEAEVLSGHQAGLNAVRAEEEIAAREARLADERARDAARRQQAQPPSPRPTRMPRGRRSR